MATCAYKGNKKGTRTCPALDGDICSRCCGKYRLKEINCPNSCVWLKKATKNHRQKHIDSGALMETDYIQFLEQKTGMTNLLQSELMETDFQIHGYLENKSDPENYVDQVRRDVNSLLRVRTGKVTSMESIDGKLARHLADHFEERGERVGNQMKNRRDLEKKVLNVVKEELTYCEEEDLSYPEFLRSFFHKFYLPGYNPLQDKERDKGLTLPEDQSEGEGDLILDV